MIYLWLQCRQIKKIAYHRFFIEMNKNTIYKRRRGVNRIACHDAVIANKMHTWQNERIVTLNHMMMHKKCFHCFVPHFYSRKMHFDAPERKFLANYKLTNDNDSLFWRCRYKFLQCIHQLANHSERAFWVFYKKFAFMTVFTSHIWTCNS